MRGSRDTGGYKRGKVYRPMYGVSRSRRQHIWEMIGIHQLLFYHPYMKDVSYAYYPDTLRIYLPVFLMMRFVIWPISTKRIGGVVPVHARASGKMEIPNLESETGISSHEYTKGNYYPSGFPFGLVGGEIKYVSSGLGENSEGSFV